MSRKNAVVFAKPDEPTFLKKIKAKIGYKEGPNIDTKNEKLPDASDDDYADRDDEKPVVVLPKNSKITEQEAEEFIKNNGEGDDDDDDGDDYDDGTSRIKYEDDDIRTEPESGGKLIFKKPNKMKDVESTNKGAKRINDDRSSFRSKSAKFDDNRKKVSNSRLLSFGEEEEDE